MIQCLNKKLRKLLHKVILTEGNIRIYKVEDINLCDIPQVSEVV